MGGLITESDFFETTLGWTGVIKDYVGGIAGDISCRSYPDKRWKGQHHSRLRYSAFVSFSIAICGGSFNLRC